MNVLAAIDAGALDALPFSDSTAFLTTLSGITHLGDIRIIALIAVSMAIVLWRHGRHSYWAGLAVATIGSAGSSTLLKYIIERPRPPHPLIDVAGYSLPSIHAAVAVALYAYLIYAVLKLLHPPHHRAPLAVFLASTGILVAISRIYLGVHYATDVLAGAMLGALWLWAAIRTEQRFRTIPRRVR